MGFFSGRVAFLRFRAQKSSPKLFGPEQIEQLQNEAFGRQRAVSADGTVAGWTAGEHILDTQFDLAKNIAGDALHFSLRVDSQKIPSDLLRAYTQVELGGILAAEGGESASPRQKRQARQAAQDRLEAEAGDGRYIRRKEFPVLWDCQSNEVLFGATSVGALDYFLPLFQRTFDRNLDYVSAGVQAFFLAEARQQGRGVDDAELSRFVPNLTGGEVAWMPDETNRDFLGNEFLLWLWFVLAEKSDSISLADGSDVAVMLARTLALECPRGQTGKETIQSEAPTRLPEAKRALQAGKLPRKVGLILNRHDRQYEFTLQAESLAVSGGKLPAPEGETERARREERIAQIRDFLETLDLLYDAFGNHRLGPNWPKDLKQIQRWLAEG